MQASDDELQFTRSHPFLTMEDSKDADGNHIALDPSPNERVFFALSVRKSKWCLIYRTLCWCEIYDYEWVTETAEFVSATLDTEAMSSCGGGHGFSTQVFDSGEVQLELPAHDRSPVAKLFSARKIRLPLCFIGGHPVSLYVDQASAGEIEQADRIDCRITIDRDRGGLSRFE